MVDERARILVIDDDDSIRTLLALILEDEGFSVDTAQNGKEAVAKSNAEFYNLAVVDFRLPDVEGTKLLLMLRETKPRMMKIMLTGYPTAQNAAEAAKNGADAFMVKPAEPPALIGKIRELLKKQETLELQAINSECQLLIPP